jgi:hypothetical protein
VVIGDAATDPLRGSPIIDVLHAILSIIVQVGTLWPSLRRENPTIALVFVGNVIFTDGGIILASAALIHIRGRITNCNLTGAPSAQKTSCRADGTREAMRRHSFESLKGCKTEKFDANSTD